MGPTLGDKPYLPSVELISPDGGETITNLLVNDVVRHVSFAVDVVKVAFGARRRQPIAHVHANPLNVSIVNVA